MPSAIRAATTRAARQLFTSRAGPSQHLASFTSQAELVENSSRWLIVGLGNQGGAFIGTRHNVGFQVVDQLSEAHGISVSERARRAQVGNGQIHGVAVVLMKPTTYMNLSGDAVKSIGKLYKIPMERTVIICDDLDLKLGKVRLRAKGSHGGHNGLRSIIAKNGGSNAFARVKIGIGRPTAGKDAASISDWVLGRFDMQEQEQVAVATQEAIATIHAILSFGLCDAVAGRRL